MRATFRTIALSAGMIAGITIGPATAENALPTGPTDLSQPGNNCVNGEIIDGSTAEQAVTRFQAAGYSDVKIVRKGCDNFWHATGTKGGQSGNILLSPDGAVMPEGE